MYLSALAQLRGIQGLGALVGSESNDWTNPGPDYPIVTPNGDGTRRLVWNRNGLTSSAVPEKVARHLARSCSDPRGASVGVFPGILDCGSQGHLFSFMPGKSFQAWDPAVGIEISPDPGTIASLFGNLDRRYWPDGWFDLYGPEETSPSGFMTPEEIKALLPPFSGDACFGTAQVGGVWRGDVQGPCPSDPNGSRNLPDGTPNPFFEPRGSGRYAQGTGGNPYRPWADPSHPLYGHPVAITPVAPQLPETHDPWEAPDPVVDPDPVDDGNLPLSPPSRPYDPTLPDGGPVDQPPPIGSGDPGGQPPADPAGPGAPPVAPPTGDPWGPPPVLDPGDDETAPPGGGGAPPAGGVSALWPLGLLVAFLVTRRRR